MVRDGKGGNDRAVPLHPDLAAEIDAERERRHGGGWGSGYGGRWKPENAPQASGWLFPSDVVERHLTPGRVGVIHQASTPGGLVRAFAAAPVRDRLLPGRAGPPRRAATARPLETADDRGYAAVSRESQYRAVASAGLLPRRPS